MAYLIELPTFSDFRGQLTVLEKALPFEIKRLFYIYNTPHDIVRGGHAHHKNTQALICLNGSCVISVKSLHSDEEQKEFVLDHPHQLLILLPEDWHTMHHFSPQSVLLVLASHHFDSDDYIYEDLSLKSSESQK